MSHALAFAWWQTRFICVDSRQTTYLTKFWSPGFHPSVISLASASFRKYPWRRKGTYLSLLPHAHFLGASKVTLHENKGQFCGTQLRVKGHVCALHLPYVFVIPHGITSAFHAHCGAHKRPQSGPPIRYIHMRLLFGSEQCRCEGLPRHLLLIWVIMMSPVLKVVTAVVRRSRSWNGRQLQSGWVLAAGGGSSSRFLVRSLPQHGFHDWFWKLM